MSYRCPYCSYELAFGLDSHIKKCVLEPENHRKFMLFVKKVILTRSDFKKGVILPQEYEYNDFADEYDLFSSRHLKRIFDILDGWDEILLEIIDIGIRQNVVSEEEFPPFLRYIFDAWCFLPLKEFQTRLKEVIEYEEQTFDSYRRELRLAIYGDMPRHYLASKRIEGPYFLPRNIGPPPARRLELGNSDKRRCPSIYI